MSEESLPVTRDAILGGAITVLQPRRGYRFSIDSILLGRFARAKKNDRVLELGAGCGVISLMIARLAHPREVVALELQPELAQLVERNAVLNELTNLRSVCADLCSRKIGGIDAASFDLVVANPPFRALGSGRESPERGRRIARSEGGATLTQFVSTARRYARNGGRVAFVFGASRSAELIATLRSHRLEPKRIRYVHPRADAPAASVLIEARAAGGVEVLVEPPLILYERDSAYTAEARSLLNDG